MATSKKAVKAKPATSKEVATIEQQLNPQAIAEIMDTLGNGGAVTEYNELNLPDLNHGILIPVNMVDEYWKNEEEGETRRMFFDRIETIKLPPYDDPTCDDLEKFEDVAFCKFIERNEDGSTTTVSSAATRLVSFFNDPPRPRLSAWEITYVGKIKNSSNNFFSSKFSIMPLLPPKAK